MKQSLLLFLIITTISCNRKGTQVNNSEQNNHQSMSVDKVADQGHLTCQLVEKEYVNRMGKSSGLKELYLRCSIQDYFIKICESDVIKDALIPYLNKGIKVKVTILDGDWDICPNEEHELQSRVGKYVIIHEIIK